MRQEIVGAEAELRDSCAVEVAAVAERVGCVACLMHLSYLALSIRNLLFDNRFFVRSRCSVSATRHADRWLPGRARAHSLGLRCSRRLHDAGACRSTASDGESSRFADASGRVIFPSRSSLRISRNSARTSSDPVVRSQCACRDACSACAARPTQPRPGAGDRLFRSAAFDPASSSKVGLLHLAERPQARTVGDASVIAARREMHQFAYR